VGAGRPVHAAERTTKPEVAVSEEQLAGAVRDLISSEPGGREREQRLHGVIARQIQLVEERFVSKNRQGAIASLLGAMYLVRTGELTAEVLGPRAHVALSKVSEELAKTGDAHRARAAYEMLLRVAPPSERPDILGHLSAISAWTQDTAGSTPMQAAGVLEMAAVARAVLEPSREAREDAVRKTLDFIDTAVQLKAARRSRGVQLTREEGMEAVRALETGGAVLAAIHVRHADPKSALSAVEGLGRKDAQLARPELIGALRAVIERPSSERWLELAHMLRPEPTRGSHGRSDEAEVGPDAELFRAAMFTAACEAYRLDATNPEAASLVAIVLSGVGLGEAAPLVIGDAIEAKAEPRLVAFGLGMTLQSMMRALDADEPNVARRTLRAASRLLGAAEKISAPLRPSVAQLYAVMGDAELREGRLEEARRWLEESAKREKSGAVFFSLARIERHDGQAREALTRLRSALAMEDVTKERALRAEVLFLMGEIQRDLGETNAARSSLTEALKVLADARTSPDGNERARLERILARVLDRFGSHSAGTKALLRALDAARQDKHQAAATVGQMIARAFVRGDLAAARDALARGQSAELERDDLVYDAVWVRLLEKQFGDTKDSAAERILAGASDDARWVGKIAAFGAGKVKVSELVAKADTPIKKTEALFYQAMTHRLAGDTIGYEETLRQVLRAPGLDLVELGLAQELLGRGRLELGGPVPDVGLP
jgi:tetratricopeptide (TPR) repeat protein